MTEEDKVGHLLKGIADDVYNFLIAKGDLNAVCDVIRHVRTFETLKTRRITPKFGRLANVPSVASIEDNFMDLSSTIRQIVREELQRFEPPVRSPSSLPSDVVGSRGPPSLLPSMPVVNSINTAQADAYSNSPTPRFDSPGHPPRYDSRPTNFLSHYDQHYEYHPQPPPARYFRRPTRRPEDEFRYPMHPVSSEPSREQVFRRTAPVCRRCGIEGT